MLLEDVDCSEADLMLSEKAYEWFIAVFGDTVHSSLHQKYSIKLVQFILDILKPYSFFFLEICLIVLGFHGQLIKDYGDILQLILFNDVLKRIYQ